jgi:glyoxylase-like metal-dependent hydrolase (beta-lactamase superfamily II)
VRELTPGLWHWEAPHPEWESSQPWGPNVSSYATDDGERLLLFDPLAVPDEILERVSGRDTAIVLTSPWHERDARSLVERLGLPLVAPPADTAEDLMGKFGITAEQAGEGSPDLAWVRADESVEVHWYAAGDQLPIGVQAFPGREQNDLVLWMESRRAVIAGDSLADFGRGLEIVPGWLPKGVTREEIAERMRPLLELPVELVLPAHGTPTDRPTLERALA